MGFETGLYTHLKNNVPLVSDRVYPDVLEQESTLPALTYKRLTGMPEYSMSGSSDLEDGRYEINVWAGTPLERMNVYAELREAVSGYGGCFGGMTGASFIKNHISVYEPETKLYREIVEVMIWHRESA